MILRILKSRLMMIAAAAAVLVVITAPVDASGRHIADSFDRRGPDELSPSGNSVIADCPDAKTGEENGWLDAAASLRLRQSGGMTQLQIRLSDARPDTYFTVWLRLGGTDSSGEPFGTNPLTDGKATPLAATGHLPDLLAATGAGNGNDQQPNGFRTNARGNAVFRTTVDFPVVSGAYPFQRFPDWDPTDPRLPAADPAIYPVAIAGPQGPYTLRIVSHCTDDVGHGLQSGPREWWFDWTVAE
ncbi:MAG: hypothetical protein OEV40_22555 [Acidimicrobiia bacterium]|nr:hypothetical protein [Acidimicrobiia bacterium]